MAGVSQLRSDVVGVAPVDRRLGGAAEEVGRVRGQRDGGHRAHHLGLLLDDHVVGADLGDGAVARAEEEVTVGEEVDGVDALGEEALDGAESLEEVALEADLDDVSGLGAHIGVGVGGVDDAAGENAANRVHQDLVVVHLLLNQVAAPGSDAVVVDSDALGGGVVEELNLVGGVGADGVSNECFAALDLKFKN